MLNIFSRVLAVVVAILSALTLGEYVGFSVGSALCEAKDPMVGGVWASDLDSYIYFSNNQRFIFFFLIIYLVCKLFPNNIFLRLPGLLFLFLSLYFEWRIIHFKGLFWDVTNKYLRLGQEMFIFDALIIIIIITLIVIEIILTVRHFWPKKVRG